MRQFSIRQYVGLVTLVPMIVIAACLEFIFLSNNFAELDSNTAERAKLLASQLGSSSEYGVVANNRPFLQNLAQSVSLQQDVRGAAILNSALKTLAETGNISGAEKAAVVGAIPAMPDSSAPVIRYFGDSLLIFHSIMPQTVVLNELEAAPVAKPIGAVILKISLARTAQHKWKELLYTIAATVVFLALCGYIVNLAIRRIINPINTLSDAIQTIGQGNLEARTSVPAHITEMSVLSGGINHMAEQLQHERDVLQQRVEDATLHIRNSKEKAEQANVAKSKFLAAASHDLRQPLHALSLFATVLNDRIKFPEVREIVRNINQCVASLEGLFNSLLDISRLDAGVVLPKFQHFSLKELMERLSTEYVAQIRQKDLSLQLEGDEVAVYSDPVLLETVLRNLISNAIRFTDSGGVKVRWRSEGALVSIEVSDTGIGIPEEYRESIFQEFQQLNNPERDRTKGLGLGLAIVRRLAELLHCTIAVYSAMGVGSVFRLEVPLGDRALISDEHVSMVQEMEHEASMRVLVIDDETAAREGMALLLGDWGHEVISAASLVEALRLLKSAPDVIIADYRLRQGQTGIDAIQNIQAKWGGGIPSLIVTGDTAPERLREAQASGFAFMHKPVNTAKLRAFLRTVARRANLAS